MHELAQCVENPSDFAHLRSVVKMDSALAIFILLLSELDSILVDTEGLLKETIPHFFDDQSVTIFLGLSELAVVAPLFQCSINLFVLPYLDRSTHPLSGLVLFNLLGVSDT